ncbi:MAG: hypothetical protein JXA44_06720 [Methanospirillaceae archaeon]|nr:hypothetical protein [Methanospirillaceae archaeon]
MKTVILFIFGVLLVLVLSPLALAETGGSATLLAVYMVGSDLESGFGSATNDINEMIEGYRNADPAKFSLVVAYGGSDKDGWEGMKIATITDLNADMADGIVGNEGLAQESYPDMNMGSREALETFIAYIRDTYPDYRKILIFWDHGGSYYGVCFDENYAMDPLTLKELRQGLMSGRTDFDLIGMDACLMGSLEVARAVNGTADYILISEEVEPGHGWDYTPAVTSLARTPGIGITVLGKNIIDSYIDNPNHEPMKKTLSLLDISKLGNVLSALDNFATELTPLIPEEGYVAIGESVRDSQRFGYHPEADVEVTIDLIGLAENINDNVASASPESRALQQAINNFIVYARNDGSRPGSHGVSIFSPRKIRVDALEALPSDVYLSDDWDLFLKSYIAYISSDLDSPVITKSDDGKYHVIDTSQDAETKVATRWWPFGLEEPSVLIRSAPAVVNATGYYDPGKPSYTGYALRDLNSGEEAIFWTISPGSDKSGINFNHGVISIDRNGEIITAYIDVLSKSKVVGTDLVYSLIPYEKNGEETGDSRTDVLFTRSPVQFEAGDVVTTYVSRMDVIGEETDEPDISYTLIPYGQLTVTGPVEVVREELPGGETWDHLVAEDLAANSQCRDVPDLSNPFA